MRADERKKYSGINMVPDDSEKAEKRYTLNSSTYTYCSRKKQC
jgi:hypothetical protein